MTAVRLLLIASVVGFGGGLVAAPVPKDREKPPTPEQLREVIEQFEKLGGEYHTYTDDTGRVRHVFSVLHDMCDEEVARLPAVPFRHDLQLYPGNVTDAGFTTWTPNHRLERLVILTSSFSGVGLEHLAKFDGLTELALQSTRTTDDTWKHVARLKELTRLSLHCSGVTDAGLKELASLNYLTHLDLSRTKVTDTGLKHLRAFPKLRSLDLGLDPNDTRGKGVTDAGLEELVTLPELASLGLRYTNVTDAGLEGGLAKAARLTELDLFSTHVTDDGVRDMLAAMPHLTKLNLGRIKLTDDGTKGLERLEHLRSLCLSHTDVGEATLERVGKLKLLTDLNLYYSEKVTDAGVKSLVGLDRLESLNLGQTAVTDAGLAEVAKLKGLKRLGLADGVGPIQVTEAGKELLRGERPDLTIHGDY